MSAISLKSITGITSITTPAGVDNQLTLHNNNTTEAVKLDVAGNLHFHNHLNITGVSTASNFKTGTSNLHNTGLNVQDLDVDGHTNLDNVSIAGITTIASGSYINASTSYRIANHPVLGYDSFTDISGGSYATRLGSTGTSTLRSTQIYGGGNVLATFDGVNYRLGLGITAPEAALHINFHNGNGSINNTLRFTNTDTTVTSNETTGKIEWETKDSTAAGIHAYLKVLCSNTGYSSMHFGTGNASTLTDRLKITQDGDVNIIDGNLVMASGHGIDFSATGNSSGSMSSELLDDYEEGSWTPSFDTSISSGSITVGGYVTQSGFYRKIGSLVYVEGALKTTSVTRNSTGTWDLGGLPFTAASGGGAGTSGQIHGGAQANWSVAPDKFTVIGSNTRARARLGLNDGASSYTNGNTTNFNTSSGQYNRVYFSGVYIAE